MDDLRHTGEHPREDRPLPADLEDLEDDGPQDGEEVVAHVEAPDPLGADAPLDEYDEADVEADTGATPDEIEAARDAARRDAQRFGQDRRYRG